MKEKDYCPALVGARKKTTLKTLLLGSQRSSVYYEAKHRTANIHLIWIEGMRLGECRCYPCVLETAEEIMVFESSNIPICRENNVRLAEKWQSLVNSENIATDYIVTEMPAKEFQVVFARYKREDLDRAIAQAERENGIAPQDAPQAEEQALPAEQPEQPSSAEPKDQ